MFCGNAPLKYTFSNAAFPANAFASMSDTPSGMSISVRAVQPFKALEFMEVSLAGIVTEVKAAQFSKTPLERAVTPLGIVTEVIPVISFIAPEPIVATFGGIINVLSEEQP